MIQAKYKGICAICTKPTVPSVDLYDMDSKRSYHAACISPEPTVEEQHALAERLGYCKQVKMS